MKCKTCGNKVPISKPLLITVIGEGVIIIFLCAIIILLSLIIASNDTNTNHVYTGKDAAVAMAKDENSSLYYKRCTWCPNYGYITNADLIKWQILDDSIYYTYKFSDDELAKYTDELEELLFEKNPFSHDGLILYTRKFGDTVQNITISLNRKSKEIDIYAKAE